MPKFEETIRTGNYVILDTETTGLDFKSAEVVCIAIIDPAGHTVLNRLIKPRHPIPPEATAIHGITDERVKGAATFRQLYPTIAEAIRGRDLIIYNADYDIPILKHCSEASGIGFEQVLTCNDLQCAMKWYAEIHGEWNDWRKEYRWQSLTDALKQQEIPIKDAHSALGDCRMTLALINKLIPLPKPAAALVNPIQPPLIPPHSAAPESPGEWLDRQRAKHTPPDEL